MAFDETDTNSDAYRPVLIEWIDSTRDESTWRTLGEMLADAKGEGGSIELPAGTPCVPCRTVSYLLHEDAVAVSVVQTATRFTGLNQLTIPRGCITRLVFLDVPERG